MSKKSDRIYTKRGRPITEPLTVLVRARDLLATGGTWCRGPMATGLKRNNHPDKFCAIGALREAANIRWEYAEGGAYWSLDATSAVALAQATLNDAAVEMHGDLMPHWPSVANFSDHHAKNVGEVVKVYDRAIEIEKANRKARKALVDA